MNYDEAFAHATRERDLALLVYKLDPKSEVSAAFVKLINAGIGFVIVCEALLDPNGKYFVRIMDPTEINPVFVEIEGDDVNKCAENAEALYRERFRSYPTQILRLGEFNDTFFARQELARIVDRYENLDNYMDHLFTLAHKSA